MNLRHPLNQFFIRVVIFKPVEPKIGVIIVVRGAIVEHVVDICCAGDGMAPETLKDPSQVVIPVRALKERLIQTRFFWIGSPGVKDNPSFSFRFD